jgi:hypothetical protein
LSLVVALAVVLALCQPTWSLLRVKQDQHNVWFDGDLTHRNVDAHLAQDLSIRVPHPLVSYIRSDDELLLFNYGNVSSSVKIAAFDYDSTLGIPPQWQQLNYTWVPDGQTCKQSDWVLPGTRHIWYVARSLTHSHPHSQPLNACGCDCNRTTEYDDHVAEQSSMVLAGGGHIVIGNSRSHRSPMCSRTSTTVASRSSS